MTQHRYIEWYRSMGYRGSPGIFYKWIWKSQWPIARSVICVHMSETSNLLTAELKMEDKHQIKLKSGLTVDMRGLRN